MATREQAQERTFRDPELLECSEWVKKLFDEMMAYLNEMGARLPKVNPDYDPEHYKTPKNYDRYIQWGPFKGKRTLEDDER